jgi:O-methyltransferase domain/Dimerisation domain
VRFWRLLRGLSRGNRGNWRAEAKFILKAGLATALNVHSWNWSAASNHLAPATRSSTQPPALLQMAAAYWISQALYVCAKLGIADALSDGPRSYREVAAAVGADPNSIYRLFRALSSVGVLIPITNDHFALTPLGEDLRTGVLGSLRSMVITMGGIHYRAWGRLLDSIKTGQAAFDQAFGTGLFDYLGENREAAAAFNGGMSDFSALVSYAVVSAYDFSGISSIVDIGGGHGNLIRMILRTYPQMTGIVYDTAATIEGTAACLKSYGIDGRCSAVAGNFFDSVPGGADAYILSSIIHDWDDDHSITLLRNCRCAMGEHARLLLIEMLMPSAGHCCFSSLLDLNMLVLTGGAQRTQAEVSGLLETAGYKLTQVIPTLSPLTIIEAIPA